MLVITFTFLVILLFQPWISSSTAAVNSFEDILTLRFFEIAEAYNSTISDFLTRYFISSRFLSEIMYDPSMIQCDLPYLQQFVQVTSVIYDELNPKPHYMFMWQKNRFCQIMWGNNHLNESSVENFTLNYLTQIADGSFAAAVFNSSEDFESPPEMVQFNSSMKIDYSDVKVATWSTQTSFIDDGDPNSDLSAISPKLVGNRNETFGVAGVVISLLQIATRLKTIANTFKCRYVLLNSENGVMIDNEWGSHLPEYIDQNGFQHFKPLADFDEFWSIICSFNNLLNNLTKIEIEEATYMAIRTPVSPMGIPLFSIIIVFSVDEISQKQIFNGSVVFITAMVFLSVVFIFVLLILRWNSKRKKMKLAKITPKESNMNYGINPEYGVIGQAIQRLRNLQLRFPKKEIFNKIMDNVISNLSEQKNRRFSITQISDRCDFCKYLVIKPAIDMSSYNYQSSFNVWRSYRTSHFPLYKNLGSLSFDWSAHVNAPAKELLRLMISIMVEEDLIFAEFDPDSLILFMQHITTKCCKDNVRTAHELYSMNFILNNFFKNWISNKIDRFVLYMAMFLYNTDSSIAFDSIEEDEFTQATEEVWSSSSSNESSSNEMSIDERNLKMHLNAFQDKHSAISRNIDFILNLFNIFLPLPKTEEIIVDYFTETLTEIMFDVQDSKQFELLGEFSSRIESKYFSVSSNPDDRILFMKALITLSHFCPYWSDIPTMLKATERLNYLIFGSNDNENIPNFHYEHASKIVAPWISIFMNFAQMNEVVYNLNTNINFWKNKI